MPCLNNKGLVETIARFEFKLVQKAPPKEKDFNTIKQQLY